MDRYLKIAKLVVLVVAALVLAGALVVGFEARAYISEARQYTKQQERALRGTEAQLSNLIVSTNNNLNGCKKCPPGLLPEVKAMVAQANANINGKAGVLPQAASAIAHTDQSINGIGGVAYQAAATLSLVGTNVDNMGDRAIPLIDHADMAVLHLDDLIKSPAVIGSLKNIEDGTAESKRGVAAAAASLEEIRDAIHQMRNPPKKSRGRRIADFILQYVISNAIKGVASK